jgi:hypothetical protein
MVQVGVLPILSYETSVRTGPFSKANSAFRRGAGGIETRLRGLSTLEGNQPQTHGHFRNERLSPERLAD